MADGNLCAVFYGPGDLRMENRPIKEPKENEVLISVRNCGVCHTDVHILDNGGVGQFSVTRPYVPGHEMSGIIAKVGAAVTKFKPGDRVTSDVPDPCGGCTSCKRGRYSLCQDVRYLGIPTMDGGLGRYVCVPAHQVYRIPDSVDIEDAALTEPVSVTVNAANRAGIGPGDTVAVFGAGPIGLLALQVARARGATTVIVTDLHSDRLEIAKELGATHTLLVDKSETDARASAQRMVDTVGEVDVALECSGAQLCVLAAVYVVRGGGCVSLVGIGKEEMTIPHSDAVAKEVDIRGCCANHYCYPSSLKLIETGKVKVKPIISHRFSLDEFPRALEMVRNCQGLKVMINCANGT